MQHSNKCGYWRTAAILVTLAVSLVAISLGLFTLPQSEDIMSLKALFAGGTVYRNIVWYAKGMKEFTR